MCHERVDVDVPRDDFLIVMCPDGDVRERCAPKFHLIEQTLEVPALARHTAGHGHVVALTAQACAKAHAGRVRTVRRSGELNRGVRAVLRGRRHAHQLAVHVERNLATHHADARVRDGFRRVHGHGDVLPRAEREFRFRRPCVGAVRGHGFPGHETERPVDVVAAAAFAGAVRAHDGDGPPRAVALVPLRCGEELKLPEPLGFDPRFQRHHTGVREVEVLPTL